MILTGYKIIKEVKGGKIKITPFDHNRITTNSYDLRLGSKLIRYTSKTLDPKIKPDFKIMDIPKSGMIMQAGDFLLGETEEMVGSDSYVPIIHAKSGTARMGLFVHVTADLIDIGYYGKFTLQLFATLPVKIYPYMLIAQVSFWQPKGKIVLYKGKYQNSDGPKPSMCYKDFGKINK
ncbi:MAG: dCTP deaminase [Candidatus Staskawiczbacteria bacterium RIFOXYB1_FULL_37_44]|uniref:dCTP deaminase n=1 Tax=Candidatus Staskawiczbacteria bacterium RIFOXYB1_FULL_37_44 TaxID=1802223 RepID=A0A1G2IXQ2_9BACT|nr:MAG: dCTP deaminase [Candidatus Staskawiczbacteria bacterium RIFOXYB1_FULL_37_44]OGZ83776.1 MAG: dCTP deaminase [Candidatus Staskawiczbacteria bacterium RIFOXYC1_FULL_37_52]OGZ88842.1 MAG: dCTP deaminase [Candidatus Staskawiczbacteria bacterium RIFOXYC2_FULL_37_19]